MQAKEVKSSKTLEDFMQESKKDPSWLGRLKDKITGIYLSQPFLAGMVDSGRLMADPAGFMAGSMVNGTGGEVLAIGYPKRTYEMFALNKDVLYLSGAGMGVVACVASLVSGGTELQRDWGQVAIGAFFADIGINLMKYVLNGTLYSPRSVPDYWHASESDTLLVDGNEYMVQTQSVEKHFADAGKAFKTMRVKDMSGRDYEIRVLMRHKNNSIVSKRLVNILYMDDGGIDALIKGADRPARYGPGKNIRSIFLKEKNPFTETGQ